MGCEATIEAWCANLHEVVAALLQLSLPHVVNASPEELTYLQDVNASPE